MFRAIFAISIALVACLPANSLWARESPSPPPGGTIGTLTMGFYNCEKDGDAGGPIGLPVPELDFRIVNGSSYKANDRIRGSYLMTGLDIVMTGGALKGMKLRRIGNGLLRVIGPDGLDSDTRCVLATRRRTPPDRPAAESPPDT